METTSFASDNYAPAHPEVLSAIERANAGHAAAYGGDRWTLKFEELMKHEFGQGTRAFLVFNGTAANVLSIQSCTRPYNAVICSEWAHITSDECGAPEKNAGVKLLTVPAPDGKVTIEAIATRLGGRGDCHRSQPRLISLTQTTELGTVYSVDEIRATTDFAHKNGLYVHMDGARIANAAAALGVSLKAMTVDAGVDVLSLGATKNGGLGAEAVVIFNPEIGRDFDFLRKQGMQLGSKMRYTAAQFEAMFTGNDAGTSPGEASPLWLRNARHANAMARMLAERVSKIPGVEIVVPTQANAVFARIPRAWVAPLQRQFWFYVWREGSPPSSGEVRDEVRWMCSWDTTGRDVEAFARAVEQVAQG